MPEPTATDAGSSFSDLVSTEQSVNNINQGAPSAEPTGEQPVPTEGQEPAEPEGEAPEAEPAEGDKLEGDLFWGKFKSPEDAKTSYDTAQTKIIEQGAKINELTKASEENTQLITAIDAALAKNPELAEKLKQALTDSGEPTTEKTTEPDIESLLDKKLDDREQQKQQKAEREDWVKNHPDFTSDNGELGHKIMDLLEKNSLPVTAGTLQMAYDHVTKDAQIAEATKKASDEALKKKELADLDRQNGAGVGGGSNNAKTEPTQSDPFSEFVGGVTNINHL